jgi:hypothetical protein
LGNEFVTVWSKSIPDGRRDAYLAKMRGRFHWSLTYTSHMSVGK